MDPKTVLEPHIEPKNSPLGPTKVKNNPKIKPNSNVRIDGIIENESCSSTWMDLKTVFEPQTELNNSFLGPQKVKIKCQNWRKRRKWKLFNYMSRPQNICRTLLRQQNQPIRVPKRQKWLQNEVKLKFQNSGNHKKWKLFNFMKGLQNSFWNPHWTQI